jgi:short-subunit dehydrogenase
MASALITGASSGIGEQFAYALARQHYHLILVARREERLQAVAREARRQGAPGTVVRALDLSQSDAPARLHAEVSAETEALDLLINNAGFGSQGALAGLPLERELEQIELNVRALVAISRLFVPAMVAAGRGTIINVASTAAFQPVPYMATYAATKAFVLSFSLALAQEVAAGGVRVMALCPGLTRTEFQAVAGTERRWLPAILYMDARTVADQALRAAARGRRLYVNGPFNRLGAVLVRLTPLGVVTRASSLLFRPPRPGGGGANLP